MLEKKPAAFSIEAPKPYPYSLNTNCREYRLADYICDILQRIIHKFHGL